jgi:hypothetical protein
MYCSAKGNHMQKIGTVQFVQIQRESLKEGVEPDRRYNPAPLLTVEKIQLTPDGIIGLTESGEELIDVHNVNHHGSRNRGDNNISIGFLQNYEAMRKRFGDHMTNGIAGENIFVEAEIDISTFGEASRYFIKHEDELIELIEVIPAPPCRPFSEFCLVVPQCPEDIKATLQFLSNGVRGYYALLAENATPFTVQAGDTLYIE